MPEPLSALRERFAQPDMRAEMERQYQEMVERVMRGETPPVTDSTMEGLAPSYGATGDPGPGAVLFEQMPTWAKQAAVHPDPYQPQTGMGFPAYKPPDETLFSERFPGGGPPTGWKELDLERDYRKKLEEGEFLIPKTPFEVGTSLVMGGIPKALMAGAVGGGYLLNADPAQAGGGSRVAQMMRNAIAKTKEGLGYGQQATDAAGTAAGAATGDVGSGVAGLSGGEDSLRAARLQAERRAAGRPALEGLPREEQVIGDQLYTPGPVGKIHDVADSYMAGKDFGGVVPPTKYHALDKEVSTRIAQAFEDMKHAPNDPLVQASYSAMIDETLAQYQAIKNSGLKLTPTDAASYPYIGNPRAVAQDIADNNHMAFFRTDAGFGVGEKPDPSHPMLRASGELLGDLPLLNNDLFRIVHDYFGHVKNGYGFRASGEDNAWRAHAAMYSDAARPAMTTETRGQNSWVNYGPFGEKNRSASGADTIYSQQKVGLLPDWVMDGLERVKNAPD